MVDKYAVSEMFGPTIQGEGPVIGRKTLFVRLAGCDYRCSWCDSKQTWQAPIVKTLMTSNEILNWLRRKALQTGVRTVTFSGGNPVLYDLTPIIEELHYRHPWQISVETQGSFTKSWLGLVDWLVVSPKGPSSGMITDWLALEACLHTGRRTHTYLKVVIFTDDDYAYAKDVNFRFPEYPMYLSVGTYTPERQHEGRSVQPEGIDREPVRDDTQSILDRTVTLAERVMQDKTWTTDPFVLPQYHVLLWGHRRGV
jgi:7-carboxy-7-deazaguanine synthase